jgi:hypothetical protein
MLLLSFFSESGKQLIENDELDNLIIQERLRRMTDWKLSD